MVGVRGLSSPVGLGGSRRVAAHKQQWSRSPDEGGGHVRSGIARVCDEVQLHRGTGEGRGERTRVRDEGGTGGRHVSSAACVPEGGQRTGEASRRGEPVPEVTMERELEGEREVCDSVPCFFQSVIHPSLLSTHDQQTHPLIALPLTSSSASSFRSPPDSRASCAPEPGSEARDPRQQPDTSSQPSCSTPSAGPCSRGARSS